MLITPDREAVSPAPPLQLRGHFFSWAGICALYSITMLIRLN